MRVVASPLASKAGKTLARVPIDQWPLNAFVAGDPPSEVWLSRTFLVQVYPGAPERISVNRTARDSQAGRLVDGITWDELMECKRQIGRCDRWAVELYPADGLVVDVANMRHLWLLDEAPSWAWKPIAS